MEEAIHRRRGIDAEWLPAGITIAGTAYTRASNGVWTWRSKGIQYIAGREMVNVLDRQLARANAKEEAKKELLVEAEAKTLAQDESGKYLAKDDPKPPSGLTPHKHRGFTASSNTCQHIHSRFTYHWST